MASAIYKFLFDDADVGIVLEVKYAEIGQEEKECRKALKQIVDKDIQKLCTSMEFIKF